MGAMTSDSATLLALVLERQFGSAWLKRWLLVEDLEVRWLAIYLAEEARKGREFGQTPIFRAIAEGRAWLPAGTRTTRAAETILVALHAGQLWPLAGHDLLATEQASGDGREAIPFL
jgi:hypothetical protein